MVSSINEGLPLVTVEASRCGAMVIGFDVGGISEAIGKENAVPHGENFICRFAKRCLSALEREYYMYTNEELNWTRTAEKEANFYKSLLLKH